MGPMLIFLLSLHSPPAAAFSHRSISVALLWAQPLRAIAVRLQAKIFPHPQVMTANLFSHKVSFRVERYIDMPVSALVSQGTGAISLAGTT